jgi:cell division protease FtsH
VRKFFKGATFYIFLFIIILVIVQFYARSPQTIADVNFSRLLGYLNEQQISEVKVTDNDVEGKLLDGTLFKSHVPEMMSQSFGDKLLEHSNQGELTLVGVPPVTTPWFIDMLPSVFMILILVVFWFVFMQNSQGGGSKVMSFGKSKAKLQKQDEGKKITFSDVAGLKEEKEELQEIVDFLKNPKRYMDLGARIPKGVLMIGPPGTGKTYLSKAVSGEAGVPFFSISGSDFVEMFVGVGASRVRDLFENAKKNSPCIVFIDEIDAVGRKRGAGLGGGHDDREQTLNQLLVEMDGFGDNQGIIIMAATNRPDILDPALLRPGRFDREVTVGVPDIKEREDILRVHTRNKPIHENVNLKVLARGTPGFTPADLENVMNEAAILTARKQETKIRMDTIEEAITKVIAGVEKKSRIISEKERKLTAYHEGGHALLARLLPDMDPVHQVTIIPRGRAGGFTMQLPTEDRNYNTKKKMERELVVLLGGRVAEKLILEDISTGAQNDLQRVSAIARAMVTKYAFSDNLGSMSYSTGEEVFLGKDMTTKRDYSEQVAAEIDREVRRLVDDAYDEALTLLGENDEMLHVIAKALLEFETITGQEFELLFEGGFEALEKKRNEEEEAKLAEEKLEKEKAEEAKRKMEEQKKAELEQLISEKNQEMESDQAAPKEVANAEEKKDDVEFSPFPNHEENDKK